MASAEFSSAPGCARIFTERCCMLGLRSHRLRGNSCHRTVAAFNEELRFLDQAMRLLQRVLFSSSLVRTEQIVRELPSRKRIEEQLRVVELAPEGRDNIVGR